MTNSAPLLLLLLALTGCAALRGDGGVNGTRAAAVDNRGAAVIVRPAIMDFPVPSAASDVDSVTLAVVLYDVPDASPDTPVIWIYEPDSLTLEVEELLLSCGHEVWISPSIDLAHFNSVVQTATAHFQPGEAVSDPVYAREMRGPHRLVAIRTRITNPAMGDSVETHFNLVPGKRRVNPTVPFTNEYLDTSDPAYDGIDTVSVVMRFIGQATQVPCFNVAGCDSADTTGYADWRIIR